MNLIRKQNIKKSFLHYDGAGKKIFLIEENDGLRDMLERALTSYGYDVMTSKNMSEAIDIFKNHKCIFDLLFSSITHGSIEWLDFLDLTRKLFPELPVLMTCGYIEQNNVMTDNGITFLIKPYTVNELLSTIQSMIRRR